MRHFYFLMIALIFMNCSTTELIDSWKSPDMETFSPSKVLIVGMMPNTEARLKFEQQIKSDLELRGINAIMSIDLFDASLRTEKMTKEELTILKNKLTNDGFDSVLLSKVIGIEDKIAYKKSYLDYKKTNRSFDDDYFMYQDIYYNPEYYDEYTVYHVETSLYFICSTEDSELIWQGYIDIVNPQSIEETVNDYANLVLLVLDKEKIINKKLEKVNSKL